MRLCTAKLSAICLSAVMLRVANKPIMLSNVLLSVAYAEGRKQAHYAECHNAEYRGARVLGYTRTESPTKEKHSSFVGEFVSYKGNKVLCIRPLGPYSQQIIFSITFKSAQ
jgi:hypothetical protein